tara:strand:+ start:3154 stop:4059 length:906 start_codon:yes stop_codon:yes gene_type:complete
MAKVYPSQVEWPTVAIALAVYGGWLSVIFYHEVLGSFLSVLTLAILITWHGSLQHEIVHGHPFRSESANELLGMIPINPCQPYRVYRRSHLRHHACLDLTDPSTDTESFFIRADTWRRLSPFSKGFLFFHQTLLGRFLTGPIVQVISIIRHDISEVRSGDGRLLRWWLIHLATSAVLFFGLIKLGKFSLWHYLIAIYLGISLTLVRTYCEHKWTEQELTRSATVSSKGFWALLFLNNNLHDTHHADPDVPWYELPKRSIELESTTESMNGAGHYSGYFEVFRRHLIHPYAHPVHPEEKVLH